VKEYGQGLVARGGSRSGLRSWKPPATATVAVLAVFGLLVYAAPALAITGQLTQLPGLAGCVSDTGSGGECADGTGLNYASSVAMSRDGTSVYVVGQQSSAVAIFHRNSNGSLTQLPGTAGCVSENSSGGACTDGKALKGAFAVVVSGDGTSVYVTSSYPDYSVASFQRNITTGALTQLSGMAGCVNETGTTSNGDICADGKGLVKPRFLTMSGDGKNVYVPGQLSDAVAVFARNTTTGELTQLPGTAGCVSETGTGGDCADGKALDDPFQLAVSADGKSLYAATLLSDSVAVFRRNATTGALTQLSGTAGCVSETGTGGVCADGQALDRAFSVAPSKDGTSVYVASVRSDAVAVFSRDTTTGALTQPAGTDGCVSETGSTPSGDTCTDGVALTDAISLTVSPDGLNVYVLGGFETYSIATFARDTTTGLITQLPGTAGCISVTGTSGACAQGKGLQGAYAVIVSPAGKNVYVASDQSDAVTAFARETP
jgi:6-phosphogluconolactonase (cycloisomerase 2 family)